MGCSSSSPLDLGFGEGAFLLEMQVLRWRVRLHELGSMNKALAWCIDPTVTTSLELGEAGTGDAQVAAAAGYAGGIENGSEGEGVFAGYTEAIAYLGHGYTFGVFRK